MNKVIQTITLILALTFGFSSYAHIKVGKYVGIGDSNYPCEFNITKVDFNYGIENPLNERAVLIWHNKNNPNLSFSAYCRDLKYQEQ